MSAVGMYTLLRRLEPARSQLARHDVYANLQGIEDIRIFMEHHVFAVWDFMSLLKILQHRLSCVEVPWLPAGSPRMRRFINEVVLEEESDLIDGEPTSHFEALSCRHAGGGRRYQADRCIHARASRGSGCRRRPG